MRPLLCLSLGVAVAVLGAHARANEKIDALIPKSFDRKGAYKAYSYYELNDFVYASEGSTNAYVGERIKFVGLHANLKPGGVNRKIPNESWMGPRKFESLCNKCDRTALLLDLEDNAFVSKWDRFIWQPPVYLYFNTDEKYDAYITTVRAQCPEIWSCYVIVAGKLGREEYLQATGLFSKEKVSQAFSYVEVERVQIYKAPDSNFWKHLLQSQVIQLDKMTVYFEPLKKLMK